MPLTYDFTGNGALSPDWTRRTGTDTAVTRVSGQGKKDAPEWSSGDSLYIWTTDQPPNDGYAQILYVGGTGGYNRIGAAFRATSAGNVNGYSCRFFCNGQDVDIYRWDNGTATSIAWTGAGGAGANTTIKISASGSTIKAYVDGVEKLSATDGNYSSGYAGFHYYSIGEPADQAVIDDWEATAPAGGAIGIAGSVSALSSTTGAVGVLRAILGVVNAIVSTSGAIKVRRSVVGSISATTSTSVFAKVKRLVSGVTGATSSITPFLSRKFSVSGAVNVISSIAGAAVVKKLIAGAVNAVSSISGIARVRVKGSLVGAISAVSSVAGDLGGNFVVKGAVDALSSIAGAAVVKKLIAGVKTERRVLIKTSEHVVLKKDIERRKFPKDIIRRVFKVE